MDENSRHNRVLEHGNFFVAIRGLGLNGMRRLSKKYASFPQKTFTRLPCPSVHLLTQPPFPPGARGGKRGREMFLFVPYSIQCLYRMPIFRISHTLPANLPACSASNFHVVRLVAFELGELCTRFPCPALREVIQRQPPKGHTRFYEFASSFRTDKKKNTPEP